MKLLLWLCHLHVAGRISALRILYPPRIHTEKLKGTQRMGKRRNTDEKERARTPKLKKGTSLFNFKIHDVEKHVECILRRYALSETPGLSDCHQ
jgi:hypothetical protein